MSLMAHMDGTECEEFHLLYMDRMGAFFIHVLDCYFVYGLFRLLAFLYYFAGLLCCLALGVPK